MTMYEYECACCGRFEERLAMGSAPRTHDCPTCGSTAKRVYSPPGLAFTSASVVALHEQDERSREVPDVVRRQAPTTSESRPPHPALAHLPRP
ncbi:FmdB family zinc ribbon protein [Streptomyces carpinensis]|uniref:Zinc ribbon domain-containing protein n=1 Tax=Streptomyces carpinensis TaxID=66369 RepID=A0ABV1W087_9ACTN|nr:zinc ribbon domain-containing protein [Streptomyces carpinensis]